MGNKTKLNKETREIILAAVRQGLRIADACTVAAITETTYYNWQTRAKEGGRRNSIYVELFEAIKKEMQQGKWALLQRILKAAEQEKFWTAAAWILERRFRAEFGRDSVPQDNTDTGIKELTEAIRARHKVKPTKADVMELIRELGITTEDIKELNE